MNTDQMIKDTQCRRGPCCKRVVLSVACALTRCWHWEVREIFQNSLQSRYVSLGYQSSSLCLLNYKGF